MTIENQSAWNQKLRKPKKINKKKRAQDRKLSAPHIESQGGPRPKIPKANCLHNNKIKNQWAWNQNPELKIKSQGSRDRKFTKPTKSTTSGPRTKNSQGLKSTNQRSEDQKFPQPQKLQPAVRGPKIHKASKAS